MIKLSREDSWVAYVLFLRNRVQLLRSVYVYVVFWTFFIFGRGKKCKNASDEIIWRTPCSTSADPLGVADTRLKTSGLRYMENKFFFFFRRLLVDQKGEVL